MTKQENTPKTQEDLFREKADNYVVCYSTTCPLREHCLRRLLSSYVSTNYHVVTSINLNHPRMQRSDCPEYHDDVPHRMPVGLTNLYYDMPGRLERAIKQHLIGIYSRKRYYEYHNGTRPVTPDVEQTIRQALLDFGWTQEPQFDGYVEEFLW